MNRKLCLLQNGAAVARREVPVLSRDEFLDQMLDAILCTPGPGWRVVS